MASLSIEYEATIAVSVRAPSVPARQQDVCFQVAVETSVGPARRDVLLRLTDPADPFFLYNLAIGEADFRGLKQAQDLKVGFEAFPSNLATLLQRCAVEAGRTQPRYLLELSTPVQQQGTATLSVIETNDFKNLTHLSLCVAPGTDADVKEYLARCLRASQARGSQLATEMADMRGTLTNRAETAEKELADAQRERAKMEHQLAVTRDVEEARHASELASVRNESAEALTRVRESAAAEARSQAERDAAALEKAMTRARELTAANKELTNAKYALEGKLRETEVRLTGAEATRERLEDERESAAADREALRSSKGAIEQTLHEANVRVAEMTQRLASREELLVQTEALVASGRTLQEQLTEQLGNARAQAEATSATAAASATDIAKANSIIARLQEETLALRRKVALRDQLAVKQEEALVAREAALAETEGHMRRAQESVAKLEDEVAAIKEAKKTLEADFGERGELLKNSENIITWLNKQLTEAALRPAAALPATATSTSAQRAPFRPTGKLPTNTYTATTITATTASAAVPSPTLAATTAVQPFGSKAENATNLKPLSLSASKPLDLKYLSPQAKGGVLTDASPGAPRSFLPKPVTASRSAGSKSPAAVAIESEPEQGTKVALKNGAMTAYDVMAAAH